MPPLNLTQKILAAHLRAGELTPGSEIGLKPDQVLTPDATATTVYLQFEATGLQRVQVDLAVIYIDHNTLQVGFENADDHRYLASVAAKYGAHFSRPGNGICHQLHLERYTRPGGFLLGSDSHTPTAGGASMLGVGAGGLDVAVALAGAPYYLRAPRVVRVELKGELKPWVAAKDIILELLRRLTVKGGVGRVFEYAGPGVATLSVAERATICNMGAELGATSSIFPSDERTRQFFSDMGRASDWQPLAADPGATYDEELVIDLAALEPLVACPHSPDNVKPVSAVAGTRVEQVIIGSCTNASLEDIAIAAAILKGQVVPPHVSLSVAPGTRRVLQMLIDTGILKDLVDAGGRILEVCCGPCNAAGQSPASGSVSVRTVNRNYKGRSGTEDALVYLASPAVAAYSALKGELADPRQLGEPPALRFDRIYPTDDQLIVAPPPGGEGVAIVRGPNIQPVPVPDPLSDSLTLVVALKAGDNVTTDDLIPGGAKLLSLRSNVPAMSEYTFQRLDRGFARRAKELGQPWLVLGGHNFGQGSSREAAVLAPLYLGQKAAVAKSFARIYRQNLINFGVLPLILADPADYDKLEAGDTLLLADLHARFPAGELTLENKAKGIAIPVRHDLTPREVQVIMSGGLLRYVGRASEGK